VALTTRKQIFHVLGDALEGSAGKRGFPAFEHLKEPVGEELGTLQALLDRRAICHDSLLRVGRYDTTRQRIDRLGNAMPGGCRRMKQGPNPGSTVLRDVALEVRMGLSGRRCRRS
jgi:hypothetical protein